VDHFPDKGDVYLEPFAGKGNVYFWARQRLQFERWILNDIDINFFNALQRADFDQLPHKVEKEDFYFWKNTNNDIATLIEPRITFGGKGYRFGYNGDCGTHVGYRSSNFKPICEQARQLLKDVQITKLHWEDSVAASNPSFAYLDPPYYGTTAAYENIDHNRLVTVLNAANFAWALSGYRNDLYDARLEFRCRFEYERNSEIKSSNSRSRESVIECLWTNYDL